VIRAFVSSTYRDLKDHRAYVIDRLARGGIFVDPMETWTAANDEPKVLSQDRVRDCDLCILLVGFRRGHVPEGDARSITQMEYAEALRRGLHVLVFMANEEADWPAGVVAGLEADPQAVQWRLELKEHKVVGLFGPRPESIDVDAALNRWLQEKAALPRPARDESGGEGGAIEIRAHSNSEGVLIVWRTANPIPGCLGFALQREVLGDAGVSRETVGTRLGFSPLSDPRPGERAPSSERPIQGFRFRDREEREVRYRVVPMLGTPESLSEGVTRSAWTGWVSPRTGQDPGCRGYFNQPSLDGGAWRRAQGHSAPRGRGRPVELLRRNPELRQRFGGGLRQRLLELLAAARTGDRRLHVVLADLDDPDLIQALAALGPNLRLILALPKRRRARANEAARQRSRLRKILRAASAGLYDEVGKPGPGRSNFVVSCDRWGTPLSVWTGSGSWTVEALCLRSNSGLFVESVPLARAYLDRWEELRDLREGRRRGPGSRGSGPVHLRDRGMSTTLWNTPVRGKADLRDASRLIRGARQGVLFAVDARRVAEVLMREVLAFLPDEDLFIEGLTWRAAGERGRSQYEHVVNDRRTLVAVDGGPALESTLVLVDPFGPHPVVITGSHDLSLAGSQKGECDLLVLENAPDLAREYAVHLFGLFDYFRMRFVAAHAPVLRGLRPHDAWQDPYFQRGRRSQFNFLFGALSPGL
jgi:Domain of unknown function (DUF4062)